MRNLTSTAAHHFSAAVSAFRRQPLTTRVMIVALTAFTIVQIVLLLAYRDYRQQPDSFRFVYNARMAWRLNEVYPTHRNIYDDYITTPGYTNYLVAVYWLFRTLRWAQVFNLLMTLGIAAEIHYLGRRLFSRRTADIAVTLYTLLPTNWFAPLWLMTEIPFLFLALGGLCLASSQRIRWVIAGGAMLALSHTVRAIDLAFLVPAVVWLAAMRRRWHHYAALLVPYVLILLGIGLFYKQHIGVFMTTSQTGGRNMLLVSHHDHQLTGYQGDDVDSPGMLGYIKNAQRLPFNVRDSIHLSRSIGWIKQHPVDYAAICLKRSIAMWGADYWSLPYFSKYDKYQWCIHQENKEHALTIRRIREAVYSVPYYLLMALFAVGVWRHRREVFSAKGVTLLVIVLGTLGTSLVTMQVRFHYPYLCCVALWAALALQKRKT